MNDETQWPKSYELTRRELPGASASLHNSIPLRVWLLLCLSTDCYRVHNNKAVRWWLQPAKRSARYAASRGAVIIRGCLLHLRLIGCSSLLRCVARKRLADRCIRHVTDSACAICKTCSIPTAGCWWSAGQSCD